MVDKEKNTTPESKMDRRKFLKATGAAGFIAAAAAFASPGVERLAGALSDEIPEFSAGAMAEDIQCGSSSYTYCVPSNSFNDKGGTGKTCNASHKCGNAAGDRFECRNYSCYSSNPFTCTGTFMCHNTSSDGFTCQPSTAINCTTFDCAKYDGFWA